MLIKCTVPGLTLLPGPPAVRTASPGSIRGAPGCPDGYTAGWPAVRSRGSSRISPSAPWGLWWNRHPAAGREGINKMRHSTALAQGIHCDTSLMRWYQFTIFFPQWIQVWLFWLLICFYAECWLRRFTPLSCLYDNCVAAIISWLVWLSIKTGRGGKQLAWLCLEGTKSVYQPPQSFKT